MSEVKTKTCFILKMIGNKFKGDIIYFLFQLKYVYTQASLNCRHIDRSYVFYTPMVLTKFSFYLVAGLPILQRTIDWPYLYVFSSDESNSIKGNSYRLIVGYHYSSTRGWIKFLNIILVGQNFDWNFHINSRFKLFQSSKPVALDWTGPEWQYRPHDSNH